MMQIAQLLAEDTAIKEKILGNKDKVFFPNFGSGDNILKEGISIDRVAFTIPGTDFDIYWYGFLICIGLLLAMVYGFKRMKSVGIDPDRATDSVIAGFLGAMFGARLYYILFCDTGVTMKQFFDTRDGGLAIYGGIIGAILCGGIVSKLRKLKLSALLDVVAPCFLIGQCIGRWGNFFNQEAFGANTDKPWGMISYTTANFIATNDLAGVDPFKPVHPCFLYESLWCLAGFVILHFYLKHRKFDGEVFLMYIGWYGLGRFFIESTRTDSLYLGNIKISQLVAGGCVIAALITIIVKRGIIKRSGNYKFFIDTELSKAQLADYNNYNKQNAEKKELKKKIKEAKEKGESFIEFEKEYEEKFGKNAEKARNEKLEEAEKKDKNVNTDDGYESILSDESSDKTEETDEDSSEKSDGEVDKNE